MLRWLTTAIVRLFHRAPFDPVLAMLLVGNPATRCTALDYILGFSTINNPDRFKRDIDEAETRFQRTYRPNKQIDKAAKGLPVRARGSRFLALALSC